VKDRLEQIVSRAVLGYRAPFFSITERSRWALSVLGAEGYRYDSSIFPVINHRYGMRSACREPHRIELGGGASIVEFPLSTWRLLGQNVPVSGGVYFRFFPYGIVRQGFRALNRVGIPGIFYIHAWEMDPGQPRMLLPPFLFLRRYHNLGAVHGKLTRLLGDFDFRTLGELYRDRAPEGKGPVSEPWTDPPLPARPFPAGARAEGPWAAGTGERKTGWRRL
jgi:polysaccharide deacetylase family protein (PEP-CTERM system associated)